MFYQNKILHRLIVCVWLAGCINSVQACSLALHDWKLFFHALIPLGAPVLPLAELDAVLDRVPRNSIEQVIWVADHGLFSSLSLVFLHFLPNWEAHLPWFAENKSSSILKMARVQQSKQKTPLIIGSDQNRLQIALFTDRNANNRCFQLVLMFTNRIRAVFADQNAPWAQETRGQAWISLVFYQQPIPGRILSLSVYPVYQVRKAFIDNHEYVEQLINDNLLTRRPEQVFDPYTFDFPDLPE